MLIRLFIFNLVQKFCLMMHRVLQQVGDWVKELWQSVIPGTQSARASHAVLQHLWPSHQVTSGFLVSNEEWNIVLRVKCPRVFWHEIIFLHMLLFCVSVGLQPWTSNSHPQGGHCWYILWVLGCPTSGGTCLTNLLQTCKKWCVLLKKV